MDRYAEGQIIKLLTEIRDSLKAIEQRIPPKTQALTMTIPYELTARLPTSNLPTWKK